MLPLVLSALLPIALIIGLGYVLRRRSFLDEAFWPQAERLSYFVLLPMLFAHGIYKADLNGVPIPAIAAAIACPAVLGAVALILVNRFWRFNGPTLTSVVQGGIRFNNYVAASAAVGLFGVPGAALIALVSAILVPTVNIVCTLVFAHYGERSVSIMGVARSLSLNPMIIGCAGGAALQGLGIVLPAGIDGFMQALGQAALPIGLLCVGAALRWNAIGRGAAPVLAASLARFLFIPMMSVAICLAIGLDGPAALVVLLAQCVPTSSSAYVMARQLGGDAPLMAAIIAVQTSVAILTVPLTLLLIGPLVG